MNNNKWFLLAAIGAVVSFSSLRAAETLERREQLMDVATRELPWDGSESLVVDLPATVRFVQAEGPGKVVVRGAASSVARFRADGGVLRDDRWRSGKPVEVVVTAPRITRFSVNGGDKLTIEQFDQPELHIEATGRAEVMASGRATSVTLRLQGFGWADLGQLHSDSADVVVSGGRHVLIAPEKSAALAGNGSVVLTTRPDVKANMEESGRVIYAAN